MGREGGATGRRGSRDGEGRGALTLVSCDVPPLLSILQQDEQVTCKKHKIIPPKRAFAPVGAAARPYVRVPTT